MLAEEGGSELLSEVISKTKGDSKWYNIINKTIYF
jgi:hypothetical protein